MQTKGSAIIDIRPVKCPRCGEKAELVEQDAVIGLSEQRRNVYACATCTTPSYGFAVSKDFEPDPDAPGFGVSYMQLMFLSDGSEVI